MQSVPASTPMIVQIVYSEVLADQDKLTGDIVYNPVYNENSRYLSLCLVKFDTGRNALNQAIHVDFQHKYRC